MTAAIAEVPSGSRLATRDLGPIIRTVDHLRAMVEVVQEVGAFVFDVETRAHLNQHPYLTPFIEADIQENFDGRKRKTDKALAQARQTVERKYHSMLALDPLRNDVFWIGIATFGRSWAIPMGHPGGGEQLTKDVVFNELEPLFFGKCVKVGHNLKFDMKSVAKYYDGDLPTLPLYDTLTGMFMLNENMPPQQYRLQGCVGAVFAKWDPWARYGKIGATIHEASFNDAVRYVHTDVRATWLLYMEQLEMFDKDPDVRSAFRIDMKVLRVLAAMEMEGIHVDVAQIDDLDEALSDRLTKIRRDMAKYVFPGFNPNSVDHKQRVLFGPKRDGGLGLRSGKKTGGGAPSTAAEVLERLRDKHPLVEHILDYQDVQKLHGTYVLGLKQRIYRGKIHTNFNLHRAVTGRLSSSEPNLQNIPRPGDAQDDLGTLIRGLFIAPPGYKLVVADYGQVELRVLASASRDPRMVAIFKQGQDIHAASIAEIMRKPIEQVTKDERQIGKGLAFSVSYGAGPEKVAAVARSTEEVAQKFIDGYYERFSEIKQWKRRTLLDAYRTGYVTTMEGRKRRLPDIRSSDYGPRGRAERQAINAVIQGSAADICKRAMIDVSKAFEGTPFRMLLQVHDELVCLAPEDQAEECREILMQAMGHGTTLPGGVPLVVDCNIGTSWATAK
jgi:DNA polymerase-1